MTDFYTVAERFIKRGQSHQRLRDNLITSMSHNDKADEDTWIDIIDIVSDYARRRGQLSVISSLLAVSPFKNNSRDMTNVTSLFDVATPEQVLRGMQENDWL